MKGSRQAGAARQLSLSLGVNRMNFQLLRYRLWVAKNTLYKITISRLRLRWKKFYRIIMKRDEYLKLKTQDEFIASIQLARFVNTLRSAQRNYLRIPDDGKLPNTKDRIEQQYTYSSIVYEIIQALFKLSGNLKHIVAWTKNTAIRKELQNEKDNKSSYYNMVLEPIRNKVMFHFEKDAIEQAVDKINLKEEMDLAISETKLNRDMVFSIVDDLVLNYIISQDPRQIDEIQKYDELLRYLIDKTEKIVSLATNCIIEIWIRHAKKRRGRLDH